MTWDKMSERERDALVAEKVMQFKKHEWAEHEALENTLFCSFCGSTMQKGTKLFLDGTTKQTYFCNEKSFPHYTTDISDAWTVVEKLRSKYLEFYMNTLGSDLWECEVEIGEANNFIVVNAKSQNPCEAICYCALRAKGVEI